MMLRSMTWASKLDDLSNGPLPSIPVIPPSISPTTCSPPSSSPAFSPRPWAPRGTAWAGSPSCCRRGCRGGRSCRRSRWPRRSRASCSRRWGAPPRATAAGTISQPPVPCQLVGGQQIPFDFKGYQIWYTVNVRTFCLASLSPAVGHFRDGGAVGDVVVAYHGSLWGTSRAWILEDVYWWRKDCQK